MRPFTDLVVSEELIFGSIEVQAVLTEMNSLDVFELRREGTVVPCGGLVFPHSNIFNLFYLSYLLMSYEIFWFKAKMGVLIDVQIFELSVFLLKS